MKIAFVCTQNNTGSTIIGRVLPIAAHLSHDFGHTVTLLMHEPAQIPQESIKTISIGKNPFSHTQDGKKRLSGFALISRMKLNAFRTILALQKTRPDVVVIVKTLPQNVFAVWLWSLLHPGTPIVVDIDDFELEANQLTSLLQRFAVHWSERKAAHMAEHIIVASPFLADHFEQLTKNKEKITLIPTGIDPSLASGVQNTSSTDPVIMYTGSISISSGHRVDLLPEILHTVSQTYPSVRLIMAGDGHDEALLKEKFQTLDLADQIKWHGRFTLQELPALLNQTTILIDPIDDSIANRSKSSFRVALAMIAGKPIITSNIGIRGMFIVPSLYDRLCAVPGDAKDYAQKIIDCIQAPLTESDIQAWKDRGKQYHWEALSKTYNSVVTSHHD